MSVPPSRRQRMASAIPSRSIFTPDALASIGRRSRDAVGSRGAEAPEGYFESLPCNHRGQRERRGHRQGDRAPHSVVGLPIRGPFPPSTCSVFLDFQKNREKCPPIVDVLTVTAYCLLRQGWACHLLGGVCCSAAAWYCRFIARNDIILNLAVEPKQS